MNLKTQNIKQAGRHVISNLSWFIGHRHVIVTNETAGSSFLLPRISHFFSSHLAFFISHLAFSISHLAFFSLHLASCISHLAFFISHLAISMSHLAFSISISHFYLASRMSLLGSRSCGFFLETFTTSGFKSLRVKPLNDMKVERT